jgi:hypothetical protein
MIKINLCFHFNQNPVHSLPKPAMANPNRLEGQIFEKSSCWGHETALFLKFSRFSSKIVIFKRLEKGRGLAMAGAKTEMNKWRNSARNETLWCQLEHEAFEKSIWQNNDPQKPSKISNFGFQCDRDFVVSLKQIKKGIGSCGKSLNLEKFNNWKSNLRLNKTRTKIVKNIWYSGHFFLKFWQKVAQKRTALEKLRRRILPFVFWNAR